MKSQLHIFDCDGVLILSNRLKTQCFNEIASKFVPENLVNQFINFHKTNGGLSRWEKFDYLRNISRDNDLPNIDNLSKQFALLFDSKLSKIHPIPGALDYVEQLVKKKALVYVVSAGEQSQVRRILMSLKFNINPDNIFGSPVRKVDHFKKIRKMHQFSEAMSYGDSLLDAKCAISIKSKFTFVYEDSDISIKDLEDNISLEFSSIKNFNNLVA